MLIFRGKITLAILFLFLLISPTTFQANEKEDEAAKRIALFKKMETITQIPWYYYAAIDQYERQIHKEKISDGVISIQIPEDKWAGPLNPSQTDKQKEYQIAFFEGMGRDGDGDGFADRTNDEDILASIGHYFLQYGRSKDDIKIALWHFYERDLNVQGIIYNARVFKANDSIVLEDRVFPLPKNYNYSYRSTWGDGRGFGGRRIHEGTDIFANYGVPVRSTTYGVIEIKGWNRFGGWRIGIRDIHNIYHYYAHLNGFADGVEVGQIVKPGDVIGSVGATGYGPPGTSGKFPPHLHYGMYKDNGYSEWSFDPYPFLRKWERMDK
ncbi:M23 family metallopeptidase [Bacillaceae bacterium S4-13-58]